MKKKEKIQEQELQKEREQYVLNYRNSVEENKNKSQDDFEKYINLLASGGLIISLTILEKITEKSSAVSCVSLFFLNIFCFILTLLLNLISHRKSISDADFILNEIGYDIEKLENKCFLDELKRRNNIIEMLNNISVFSLIIGVVFIFIFLAINILNL